MAPCMKFPRLNVPLSPRDDKLNVACLFKKRPCRHIIFIKPQRPMIYGPQARQALFMVMRRERVGGGLRFIQGRLDMDMECMT